ncbi:MAG TPA: SHOCT domain-containing protein [Nocardioidaceae bacterium]|nr:SHOCT domain-containing protein [Nocardioidaceae bacterium]
MPGLIRGVARTAVVAGTATAVSGRVQRRQAERYAERDAQLAYQQDQAYQQTYYQQAPPPPAAPASPAPDVVQQLKDLAALREQGILTEEEFAAQKVRILAG